MTSDVFSCSLTCWLSLRRNTNLPPSDQTNFHIPHRQFSTRKVDSSPLPKDHRFCTLQIDNSLHCKWTVLHFSTVVPILCCSNGQFSTLQMGNFSLFKGSLTLCFPNGPSCTLNRSDYSKEVGGQFVRIRLKIAKKCGLYLDIFSCVNMNIFRSFFAFMLEMHVRCDNQYKTGADRENILGQPMLFVYMGICVLSPAHES